MIKKSLIIVLVTLIFMSCDEYCGCEPPPIDENVEIHYRDSSGKSLVNSSNQFADSNITIYYKQGDIFRNAKDMIPKYDNNFSVFKNQEGKTILAVFVSGYYEGDFSETILEFNGNVRDTIRCEFIRNDKGRTIKNVWCNGIKMDSRIFELIK